MEKRKNILLLLIFVFSFAYRLLLITAQDFPPGADIGNHESLIQSITSESPDFLVNNFHMGGGLAGTNPGYHIFVLFFRAFTGLPDYLCHSFVASFFSALTFLCIFLLLRKFWSESSGFIASFLIVFSAGDIEMLSWGGYPNITALFIIPLIAYFYLQSARFSKTCYFVITSLLAGTLLLTHVFSALVYIAILLAALILVSLKREKPFLQTPLLWVLPFIFGATLVSPYLFRILPVYFGPEAVITGGVDQTIAAMLETRLVPLENAFLMVLPVVLLLFLSKLYKGKYFTITSALFAVWVLVPIVMTQSYLFGFYVDYQRFVYFLYLPLIAVVALLLDCGLDFLDLTSHTFDLKPKRDFVRRLKKVFAKPGFPWRILNVVVFCVLLVVPLFFLPLFALPGDALVESSYYQVMTPQRFDAIEWIKTNTPKDSVLVSDAQYGWWISGFAQRKTLSSVPPQYLILTHELEPASIAKNLLHSNYFISNGLVAVNYDLSNNSDILRISATMHKLNFPYHFFELQENSINALFRNNGSVTYLQFSDLPLTNRQIKESTNSSSYEVTRENSYHLVTESITVYTGVRFAKITIHLQSKTPTINYDWLHVPVLARGMVFESNDSIAFFDASASVLTQTVFPTETIGNSIQLKENPKNFEIIQKLDGTPSLVLEFFVGATSYEPSNSESTDQITVAMTNNSETYLNQTFEETLFSFDYKAAIKEWDINYVVATYPETIARLNGNSVFNCVFKNGEVSIFKIDLQE
ncbi:MAG: glycosyltransferase family 39 protein [Candidatus Bathyarchaeota archaeon]|nr:glycosyltransferase family 39 protein [Candidatus Bathyarchaeota archaeon]